jgi:hypothetical protein
MKKIGLIVLALFLLGIGLKIGVSSLFYTVQMTSQERFERTLFECHRTFSPKYEANEENVVDCDQYEALIAYYRALSK